MSKYHVQAGGKLYLTGEYAILRPGQTALICYIPIMLTAVIEAAEAVSISSDMFDHAADLSPDKDYRLIQASIEALDRKSTRLNSSHANISYAVFCLKKKKRITLNTAL